MVSCADFFISWSDCVTLLLAGSRCSPDGTERDPLKSAKTTSLSSHASDPLLSYPTVRCSISCLTDGAPLGLLGRPNIRDNAYVYLLVGNCKFPGANNHCFGAGLTFLARAANVVRRRSRIDKGHASRSGFCLCSPSICKLVPKYIWIVLELLPCPSL